MRSRAGRRRPSSSPAKKWARKRCALCRLTLWSRRKYHVCGWFPISLYETRPSSKRSNDSPETLEEDLVVTVAQEEVAIVVCVRAELVNRGFRGTRWARHAIKLAGV